MSKLITRGLSLSGTLLFRILTLRAFGFLRKPSRVMLLGDQTYRYMQSYEHVGAFTDDLMNSVRQVVRLAKHAVTGEYQGLSKVRLAMIVAVILYFLSPLDIIPDTIPVLGILDDISLFSWLLSTLGKELQDFGRWEQKLLPPPEGWRSE